MEPIDVDSPEVKVKAVPKDGVEGHMTRKLRYPRQQMIEQATLSKEDLYEIAQCRRSHNRLGFAYQIGFVRLNNRFPIQSPFDLISELLQYISAQMGTDPSEIYQYTSRQPTISAHQTAIRRYLNLKELLARKSAGKSTIHLPESVV